MNFFVTLLLLSNLAAAGNRVGNGGDVVVCSGRTELLDFYEAAKTLAGRGSDYQGIIADRLAALEKVAPKLAEQYSRRAKTIQGEIDFRNDVRLTDVTDSMHGFLPGDKSCRLKQIAIRQEIPVNNKRFLVDQKLWKKLEPRHQAGLILHEIIYEHFTKLGASDSRKARKLNAFIFSADLAKTSGGKFWLMIKDLEIPVYP